MTYPEIIQPAVPKLPSEGSVIAKNRGPSGKDHFGFKNFQLEDYARGALHDGLVLDAGGTNCAGKTKKRKENEP
jgi:hypothetical protein